MENVNDFNFIIDSCRIHYQIKRTEGNEFPFCSYLNPDENPSLPIAIVFGNSAEETESNFNEAFALGLILQDIDTVEGAMQRILHKNKITATNNKHAEC